MTYSLLNGDYPPSSGHVWLRVDGDTVLDQDFAPTHGPPGHVYGAFCPASCTSSDATLAVPTP